MEEKKKDENITEEKKKPKKKSVRKPKSTNEMKDKKSSSKKSKISEENIDKLNKFMKNQDKSAKRPDGKRGFKLEDDGKFWKKGSKTFVIWMVVIAVALIAMNFMDKDSKVKELSYNDFNSFVDQIKSVKITNVGSNAEITGDFVSEIAIPESGSKKYEKFKLIVPSITKETADLLTSKGIKVEMVKEEYGVSDFLITMLPWVLFIFLWIYLMRKMQGGGAQVGKGIFSFGKNKAKLVDQEKNKITFKDVAGSKEAKEELQEDTKQKIEQWRRDYNGFRPHRDFTGHLGIK